MAYIPGNTRSHEETYRLLRKMGELLEGMLEEGCPEFGVTYLNPNSVVVEDPAAFDRHFGDAAAARLEGIITERLHAGGKPNMDTVGAAILDLIEERGLCDA